MARRRLVPVLLLLLASCTQAASPPGSSGSSPPPGRTSPGQSASPGARPAYDDAGPLGGMARSYLRASPASRLVVEVDWVAGREPGATALDHLRRVLADVCDKPGGVVIERGGEIASARSSYGRSDIVALERANRSRRSAGDTATMWVVYLNGSFADDEGALGVAYEASGAAIFRDRIDDATTAIVNASRIESAVLTHEAGHLLALVNIGYRSATNHEDPEHPHHSRNRDSVMYWAVEDVSLRTLLAGGPPEDFDQDDRADLEVLKAG